MIKDLLQFLSKITGISTDYVASLLVTITIFAIGLIFTKISKYLTNASNRSNHRLLLRINLIRLIRALKNQGQGFSKLHPQVTIENDEHLTFTPLTISALDIFSELGYQSEYNSIFKGINNLLKIFLIEKRQRAFNDIWSAIIFFKNNHQKFLAKTMDFQAENNAYNEARNLALQDVSLLIEEFRLTFHNESPPKQLRDYYNAIEDIIIEHRKQASPLNPKTYDEYYTQKILLLNRNSFDGIKPYIDLKFFNQLNNKLLVLSLRYINKARYIDFSRDTFHGYSMRYLAQTIILIKAYRTLFPKRKSSKLMLKKAIGYYKLKRKFKL